MRTKKEQIKKEWLSIESLEGQQFITKYEIDKNDNKNKYVFMCANEYNNFKALLQKTENLFNHLRTENIKDIKRKIAEITLKKIARMYNTDKKTLRAYLEIAGFKLTLRRIEQITTNTKDKYTDLDFKKLKKIKTLNKTPITKTGTEQPYNTGYTVGFIS